MSKPSQSDLHTLITLPSGNIIIQSSSSLVSSVSLIITLGCSLTSPLQHTTPLRYSSHPRLLHVCHFHISNILYVSATPHFFIQLHSSCLSIPAYTWDLQHDAALSSSALLLNANFVFILFFHFVKPEYGLKVPSTQSLASVKLCHDFMISTTWCLYRGHGFDYRPWSERSTWDRWHTSEGVLSESSAFTILSSAISSKMALTKLCFCLLRHGFPQVQPDNKHIKMIEGSKLFLGVHVWVD